MLKLVKIAGAVVAGAIGGYLAVIGVVFLVGGLRTSMGGAAGHEFGPRFLFFIGAMLLLAAAPFVATASLAALRSRSTVLWAVTAVAACGGAIMVTANAGFFGGVVYVAAATYALLAVYAAAMLPRQVVNAGGVGA